MRDMYELMDITDVEVLRDQRLRLTFADGVDRDFPYGWLPAFRPAPNSLNAPPGVTRPIALGLPSSVNHRLPSAPAAMKYGQLPAFRPALNSLIAPRTSGRAVTSRRPLRVAPSRVLAEVVRVRIRARSL